MPKKPSKSACLFDIRLRNLEHDVLVIKGDALHASSVLLSGKIVLSVNEPILVRRLSMRVYSTMRLNWVDTIETTKGSYPRPQRIEKRLFEHLWDALETQQYLQTLFEQNPKPSSGTLSSTPSSSSLSMLGFRSKSSTLLSQESKTNMLAQGNYEVPFSTVLPGSLPESIEGLPGASVVYRVEALLDRGKFHNPLSTKKHLRVVRTLTTDAVELSETVAVDNTWPKKVEYLLSVPTKAIAIGSSIPVTMTLVPLLKGLRLGDIKIELLEYYSYVGMIPPAHNGERVVLEKTIPKLENPDHDDAPLDKWEIESVLRVPASLLRCTQDADITTHIKVRHKLKFAIGLVNPDGHVSELRASLPVQLFISPFVSVTARHDAEKLEPDNSSAPTPPVDDDLDEDVLFKHSASNTSLTQLADAATGMQSGNSSHNNSYTSMTGLMAPPLYEKHIYDRLWSDVSPVESPVNSGTTSPRYSNRLSYLDIPSEFAMSPIDPQRLLENLRMLQRAESNGSSPAPGRATFNLDGDDYFTPRGRAANPPASGGNHLANHIFMSNSGSGVASGPTSGLTSPGVLSPPNHLSRANSDVSSLAISKVPSYAQAMKSDSMDQILAPMYEPPLPGSNINLDEVNRKFEEANNTAPKTSRLARGSSSLSLKNMSRLSLSGSSPVMSREASSSNLAAINRRSPSTSGVNIALLGSGSGGSTPKGRLITQPSSSAADRAAVGSLTSHGSSLSLHNLHFKKKK